MFTFTVAGVLRAFFSLKVLKQKLVKVQRPENVQIQTLF